jgi:hypothetical protein
MANEYAHTTPAEAVKGGGRGEVGRCAAVRACNGTMDVDSRPARCRNFWVLVLAREQSAGWLPECPFGLRCASGKGTLTLGIAGDGSRLYPGVAARGTHVALHSTHSPQHRQAEAAVM